MNLKLYKNNIDKCINKYEIYESLQLINGSDTDFITPTGKVYRYYKQIDKYFPVSTRINPHNGYVYVSINYKYKHNINRRLNILVAESYVNNPNNEDFAIVGHRDNDKTNNIFTNLYWTNTQENTKKAVNDGLFINKTGIDNETSNPIKVIDLYGNVIAVYGSMREAERYIKNIDLSYLNKVVYKNGDYTTRNKKYKYILISKEEYKLINKKYKNILLEEMPKNKKQNRIFKAVNIITKEEFVSDNQKKFGKEHNIPQARISHCLINNTVYNNTWKFETIKNIDYTESSGYNNLINLTNDIIVENILTKEKVIFKTIKELKDYFKLEGHDIKQYFKRGILIFSKWKIIQI